MKVAVSGSSGLIGAALGASLAGTGDEMLRLVRRPPASAAEIQWDPDAPAGALDPAALAGADAVVHLAGVALALPTVFVLARVGDEFGAKVHVLLPPFDLVVPAC